MSNLSILGEAMSNYAFSLFVNVKASKRSIDVSIERLIELVKCPTGQVFNSHWLDLKSNTEQARAALQNNDAKKYSDIKMKMPAITPHAYYPCERKDESFHTISGIIMLDFDHLENPEEILDKAKQLSCVIMTCKSLSGKGIHLLIKYTPIEEQYFTPCYQAIMEYVRICLGENADKACKNISRMMILNHDPDVYYNPNAIPLDMSGMIWLDNNSITYNIITDMDSREQLSAYLDAAMNNLNWTVGNRHNTLVSLAGSLNRAGFSETDVVNECCKRYVQNDFETEEIEQVIGSIYKDDASEHGSNQKKFTPQKDKKSNGQKAIKNLEKQDEDFFDEEEMLSTPCPEVETIKRFIPVYFFQHVVDPQSNKEAQFASVMSLLTAIGAMMRNVNCFVKPGEIAHPYLFMCLIGEAASGKSCINRAAHLFYIHAEAIENESKNRAKQKLSEIKEWQKCIKNCDSDDCGCGEEPEKIETVKIVLSLNASQNKLIKQLSVNGDIPALLFSSETDFFMDLKEMPLSTSLRALYENEPMSSHTLSRGDDTVQTPKGALLTAGTPAQQIRYFKNKEDGLVSRHITLFLPETDYISLKGCMGTEENCTREAFVEESETIRNRTLTYSNYVSTHEFWLHLTDKDRELLDEYFSCVETRFAKYSSNALTSFLRRLRGINIRLALILSVNSLFMENKLSGKYDIPEEIIRLIISWNDYLVEQNIKLLNILPENQLGDGGTELKYAHVFDSLPCNFTFSDACTLFEEKAGVSPKTAQRALKRWVKKGLLTQHLQHYYKVNCQESPSRA